MATVKQLEERVNQLSERIAYLHSSHSDLRDELVVVKNNYNTLVKEMSSRLEIIHNRFQSR